ncbi:hypothetical protein DENSPDRAFT_308387 [Dentipellis sp. KUC8613]|nr:hypothetical protein DENSPDRAFT_308387 [Dentipellis sp. KUC8613]
MGRLFVNAAGAGRKASWTRVTIWTMCIDACAVTPGRPTSAGLALLQSYASTVKKKSRVSDIRAHVPSTSLTMVRDSKLDAEPRCETPCFIVIGAHDRDPRSRRVNHSMGSRRSLVELEVCQSR